MMTWDEVMALLYEPGYVGKRTSFDVLRAMLSYLGSPQERLRFVHVAGTNGKGSASRMMQEILTRAGYRTGLFISPHLKYMNERWTMDGEMIADEDLRDAAVRTREAVAAYNRDHASIRRCRTDSGDRDKDDMEAAPEEKPVSFALLTMMAFDYFARNGCDIVVLEVGIGGRLDSTNVIPTPDLAIIMNIGLEHTELLGNTLEEIAFEKGGIIKPGGEVVLYHQSAAVEQTIRGICAERGAKLIITEPALLHSTDRQDGRKTSYGLPTSGEDGTECARGDHRDTLAQARWTQARYTYREHKAIRLNLEGFYQRGNMLAVLDGIGALRRRGLDIPEQAVSEGLANVTWPGRFEIISSDPLVIVDGAHNPNGIEALVRNLRDPVSPTAGKGILFVVGILADKDVPEMLRLLAPYAAGFIMETAPAERAEPAQELCTQAARYYDGPVKAAVSLQDAVRQALRQAGGDTAVVCCGSLYQVAEIRECVRAVLPAGAQAAVPSPPSPGCCTQHSRP